LPLAFVQESRDESPEGLGEGTVLNVANSTSESPTSSDRLMEAICDPINLECAIARVIANGGAAGVDGMPVKRLEKYFERHRDRIVGELLAGTYRPQPVKRVEIPKSDGGATGDLTKRLSMPAVYNLAAAGLLPDQFTVVGVAIESLTGQQFAEKLKADVKATAAREIDDDIWSRAFDGCLFYASGDFGDAATYRQLASLLEQVDGDLGTAGNYLLYLATPPTLFFPIIRQLAAAGLTAEADPPTNWRRVVGYRQSPNVAPDSNTETFVAFKLAIDNWRWADVPFYLRTGKSLAQQASEVVIQFRRAPFLPFCETAVENLQPNNLVLRIQPDEGISLSFEAKRPGIAVQADTVQMDFNYAEYFQQTPFIGYETLLYDCMTGDQTLFQRADFVEAGWHAITPILDVWSNLPAR